MYEIFDVPITIRNQASVLEHDDLKKMLRVNTLERLEGDILFSGS